MENKEELKSLSLQIYDYKDKTFRIERKMVDLLYHERTHYKVGDRFRHKNGTEYLLIKYQHSYNDWYYTLVDLKSGETWDDGISLRFNSNKAELNRVDIYLFSKIVGLTKVADFTKIEET